MKIEKINENQIRCTLTKVDLEQHQVRISELAYGTEKAKQLFREMMKQAQIQFGFEADNIPLMIEAIPVNMDCLILIVTKVEDPEELDTRFSKFAPYREKDAVEPIPFDGADNIIDIFQKLVESQLKRKEEKQISEPQAETAVSEEEIKKDPAVSVDLIRLYSFHKLDDIIAAAHVLNGFYQGCNPLYKNHTDGMYHLVLHQSSSSAEDFNKVCNILSEYGKGKAFQPSGEAYLKEHADLITTDAIQTLAQL